MLQSKHGFNQGANIFYGTILVLLILRSVTGGGILT
jgi:hypothetical protein